MKHDLLANRLAIARLGKVVVDGGNFIIIFLSLLFWWVVITFPIEAGEVTSDTCLVPNIRVVCVCCAMAFILWQGLPSFFGLKPYASERPEEWNEWEEVMI